VSARAAKLVTVGTAADEFGVAVVTLRRWFATRAPQARRGRRGNGCPP
jgi:hypothetical protein